MFAFIAFVLVLFVALKILGTGLRLLPSIVVIALAAIVAYKLGEATFTSLF